MILFLSVHLSYVGVYIFTNFSDGDGRTGMGNYNNINANSSHRFSNCLSTCIMFVYNYTQEYDINH